jgi:hypothetical protein
MSGINSGRRLGFTLNASFEFKVNAFAINDPDYPLSSAALPWHIS